MSFNPALLLLYFVLENKLNAKDLKVHLFISVIGNVGFKFSDIFCYH